MPVILPSTTVSATVETAGSIVEDALSVLRVNAQDTTLPASEMVFGMRFLNRMIASWAGDSLTLYHVTRESFSVAAGHNPSTWGLSTSDWTTARPSQILQASVTVPNGVDFPVRIIEWDDYEMVRLKTLQANYPQYLYYDANYPAANVYLYPVPATATTINIDSYKVLTGWTYPEQELSLPPGYSRALVYNLAIELAPLYQVSISPDARAIADEALRNLKRVNSRTPSLAIDPALRRGNQNRYNIYTDNY